MSDDAFRAIAVKWFELSAPGEPSLVLSSEVGHLISALREMHLALEAAGYVVVKRA